MDEQTLRHPQQEGGTQHGKTEEKQIEMHLWCFGKRDNPHRRLPRSARGAKQIEVKT